MNARIRYSVICLFLALGLTTSTAVRAEDSEFGALGVSDYIRWSFLFGSAGVDLQAPLGFSSVAPETPPYETLGGFFLTQFRYSSYFAQTRFGTLVGIDAGTSLGWFWRSALAQNSAQLEPMTWGRFYWDMDLGIALCPLYWGETGPGAGRLALATGAGFNLDYAYMYLIPKFSLQILDNLGIEAEFWWLPLAHSFSGNSVREWRVRGELVWSIGDEFSLGFGAEMRNVDNPMERDKDDHEYLDDNPDRIRKQDAIRGHFSSILGSVSLRWR